MRKSFRLDTVRGRTQNESESARICRKRVRRRCDEGYVIGGGTMTKTFSELQALYLEGMENMSAEDSRDFLELLKADSDAPFRNTRIPILERHLAIIDRMSEVELLRERTWRAAA